MTNWERTKNYRGFWGVDSFKIYSDKNVGHTNTIKSLTDQINVIQNKDVHPKRMAMLWKDSSQYTDEERNLARLNPDIEQDKKTISQLQTKIKNYGQAIAANESAVSEIRESTAEQVAWSEIKQQTQQAYLAWQSSKRWDTTAELAKSQADFAAAWAAERANIKAQWAQWLATAQANLANTQFNVWEATRNFEALQQQYWGSIFKKATTPAVTKTKTPSAITKEEPKTAEEILWI